MDSSDKLFPRNASEHIERETVAAYMPIIKVYLMLISFYYLVVTINHFSSETGFELVSMVAMSLVTSLIIALCYRGLKGDVSLLKLEAFGAIACVLMLTNLLYFYTTQYDSHRLVYFVLMTFIFALTSATWRLAVVASLSSLASLYAIILICDPAVLQVYTYIGIASAFAALGCSLALRRVVTNTLNAKLEAATRRVDAMEAAEHATQLSITDNLTGLPNRRDFFRTLKMRAAYSEKKNELLAMFLIDLDGFKPVNDTYGHGVGDNLLMSVGERLSLAAPDEMYIARIGGDEFAAISVVASEEDARAFGDFLCETMRAPFNLGRFIVHVGATVGVATREDVSVNPEKLVEQADYALFHAKRSAKGTCALFTKSDAEEMMRLFIVDQALRGCDLEEEMQVVYQPQFNMRENRISGFEALARWNSSELGRVVKPDTFIKVAEASGQISAITHILLAKALVDLKSWPDHLKLSFNLSVHDILDLSSVDTLLAIVKSAGVDPSRVCFEITETVMMADIEKANAALNKLVAANHEIALDDFGTGYSNFAYLHKLPIHKIKIDRSFIKGVSQNKSSAKVVASLLVLTRSLDKDCIVEGVETEGEYIAMKSLGAREIQGFYFGKPMPASQARELVQQEDIAAPLPQNPQKRINQT